MSECRRICDRLPAYVDGTLAADERAAIDHHLAKCPPCRVAATEEHGGRAVLRECAARLKSTPVPPGLRTRCAALAHAQAKALGDAHARRGTGLWRVRFVPAFLVAMVLIFSASAIFSLATRRSDAVLAAQLTADHVKCFRVFAEPNTSSADAHQVEAALSSRYGWDVHIPPSSAAAGVMLIGARRCLYGEGTLPHVMYRVNGQDVSLYVLSGEARNTADVHALGHQTRIWSRGGTTYILVTPSDAGEFAGAARYMMEELD